MKLAILGKGKTGNKVIERLKADEYTIFDTKNIPTLKKLEGHDVIISFLPGEAFFSYLEILVESKIPVVTGSTGREWPKSIGAMLKNKNLTWIRSNNFSLGMNLVKQMILTLSKADKLFEDPKFKIHEVHHTQKLDAPSGTALSWQEWSKHNCDISSERTGDVVGDHKLTIETEFENITIEHHAKDRGIFASGALWAARQILDGQVPPGLNDFSQLAAKEIL